MKWSFLIGLIFWIVVLQFSFVLFKGGDIVENKTPVQFRRVYIDLPIAADEKLTEAARLAKVSKKAYVEQLVLADTAKSARKRK